MALTPALVGPLSAQRRSCWLEERLGRCRPFAALQDQRSTPENDGIRPFGFHDHSRLRRV